MFPDLCLKMLLMLLKLRRLVERLLFPQAVEANPLRPEEPSKRHKPQGDSDNLAISVLTIVELVSRLSCSACTLRPGTSVQRAGRPKSSASVISCSYAAIAALYCPSATRP